MRAARLNRGSLSGTPCIEAAGEIGGRWSILQATDEFGLDTSDWRLRLGDEDPRFSVVER